MGLLLTNPLFVRLVKYYFTEADNSEPALNLATCLAAIWISFPVLGLRPLRAARLDTEKVPKPTNVTFSPLLNYFEIASIVAFNACVADALVIFASAAIASIKSALFMLFFVFRALGPGLY